MRYSCQRQFCLCAKLMHCNDKHGQIGLCRSRSTTQTFKAEAQLLCDLSLS
jgi:hypothetical protein